MTSMQCKIGKTKVVSTISALKRDVVNIKFAKWEARKPAGGLAKKTVYDFDDVVNSHC